MNFALLIAILASMLAGFFAACYSALRTFSRSKLAELLEERGKSERFEPFMKKGPHLLLVAAMIRSSLNLLALLAALYFFEFDAGLPEDWQPLGVYACALLLAAALVSVFSVALPTSLAQHYAEKLLLRAMPILRGSLFIFSPALRLILWIDPIVRRVTGAEFRTSDENEIADEIISVVEHRHEPGAVDDVQRQMIEAIFEFKTTTVGEIMTPRTDVEGLEVGASLDDVRRAVIDMGHSRIPVFEEHLDHIVGILYVKDLLKLVGEEGNGFNLRKICRQAMLVPETKPVSELLSEFQSRKVHMAIVLDEYGGTAGLVTIEDILEELVGEIEDEYEPEEPRPSITRVDERTVDVDARVYVHELNDELDLELPEDADYDTVGGFVFATLGHIPDVGETFDYDEMRVTVTDAERTKVNRVRFELPVGQNGNGKA